MKALVTLLLLAPSTALAGEFDMSLKAEFGFRTNEFSEQYVLNPRVGFRYDTVFGTDKQVVYIVPAIFLRKGEWKAGPELRLPVLGQSIEKYRLLFKLELSINQ